MVMSFITSLSKSAHSPSGALKNLGFITYSSGQSAGASLFLKIPKIFPKFLKFPKIFQKTLDTWIFLAYDKHKLVRFTGVPLPSLVECGDFNKNKNSGLKQTNVPQGGRASVRVTGSKEPVFSDYKDPTPPPQAKTQEPS